MKDPQIMERFSRPHLIIVEGKEDQNFIINLLRFLKLADKIYVHAVGGESNLCSDKLGLEGLPSISGDMDFKENVKNIAIIFDADNDCKTTRDKNLKKIKKINQQLSEEIEFICDQNQAGQLKKPKIHLFLFPSNDLSFNDHLTENEFTNGTLETLCFNVLKEKDSNTKIIEKCISNFLECTNKITKIKDTKKEKIEFLSFLALKNLKDAGALSSKTDIFDFESKKLEPLKKFLTKFSD